MRKIVAFCFTVLWPSFTDAQNRVGINTASPQSTLHVENGSVLLRGVYPPVLSEAPPVSGAGTRLMWYPDKAAFRAGSVDSTEWDGNNIGSHSFACGRNTIASGSYSVAMGWMSEAAGSFSCAATGGKALGLLAVAFGSGSEAIGTGAFVINASNTGEGANSLATGAQTRTSGSYSFTNGFATEAKTYASVAIGRFNEITGVSETSWFETDPVFVIGNGTGYNTRSNALTVLKNGRIGILTSTPSSILHANSGTGGGMYHPESDVIIEDSGPAYIQFSTPSTQVAGILSGNTADDVRSGIVFSTNDGVDLRAGGNMTRLQVESDGDIDIMDGELHRTPTGNAHLLPVCYGSVNSSGGISSGTGNFTVTNPSTGRYDIDIDNVTYLIGSFASSVVPVSSAARIVSVSSAGGAMVVRVYDAAGTLTDNAFQFIVFRP